MNEKILKVVLGLLVGIFILILVCMSPIGMGTENVGIRGIMIFIAFTSWILFFLLGIVLVFCSLKLKVEKR